MRRVGAVVGALAVAAAAAAPGPVRLATVSDPRILESSGLAASPTDPQVVWTVNDSGDSARTFAILLRTGRTLAVVRERTDARDCEAMASGRDPHGRPVLWIGDIGDNRADRASVVLRLLREPEPIRSETVTPVSLRVRYPGGPADAETLIWTATGRLLIVTKGLVGGTVLQVPPAAVSSALAGHDVTTPALARLVGRVSQVLPTDGVGLPDGRVVVRDYTGATVYAPPAYDGRQLVAEARLALPEQPQGETMAVVDGGRAVVVGSEGRAQPLWQVGVPAEPAHAAANPGADPASRPGDGSSSRDVSRLVGAGLVAVVALVAAAAVGQLVRSRRRAHRS